MAESYMQVFVKCPFYQYHDGRRHITCEGITDDCSLTLNYKKKAALEQQINIFCCDKYRNCEVYRILMHMKYDED